MSLVAYISGHGLGHSAREVEVLRYLPADIPLVIRTSAPRWFYDLEVSRPFEFVPDSFDVGCIQKNGLEMDVPATLAAWRAREERNRARRKDEKAFLQSVKATLVLSDVPSFPLTIAAELGVPSILIANFTWADIYRAFVDEEPAFAEIAERLQAEYETASLLLEAGFALPMPYLTQRESVGLIARAGQSRREELFSLLPAGARGKRLALVYVSGWGLPIAYENVAQFSNWHFISLDAPATVPLNWTVLPRDQMPHPDYVASVDLVVSKPGYGLAAECVSLGTPLLYPPRPAFAEYAALDAVLSAWSGGIKIPLEAFFAGDWGNFLRQTPQRGTVPMLPASGGPKAAQILQQWYRTEKHR